LKTVWKYQEAERQLGRIIKSALSEGPQYVTQQETGTVVIISVREYEHLVSDKPDFADFLISSSGESENILKVIKYCEANDYPYGILTGFAKSNSARVLGRLGRNAKFDYHVNSKDYGVVECVHQIFLHGVVE